MKKKSVILLSIFLLMLPCAAQALPLTMAEIGDGTIQIGDKVFGDFSLVSPSGGITPAGVTVSGSQIGDTVYIKFEGGFSSVNGIAQNYDLFYSVRSTGGPITSIDQSFGFGAGGTGGTISIGESVWETTFLVGKVAQSSVGYVFGNTDPEDPPAEIIQGDHLVLDKPLMKVYVTKDINLLAAQGGLVDASIIQQSFHQQVPEPGTMLLLGAGLLGLAAFRRKKD